MLYRRLIERQTTLKLDPGQVHRLGLREVARIQREMEGVRREMGFAGTLREFFDHIRTDPRFHPKTKRGAGPWLCRDRAGRSMRRSRASSCARPRTPLVIQPYPEYREKYEAGGSYNQGVGRRLAAGHVLLQHLRPAEPVPDRHDHALPPRRCARASLPDQPARRRTTRLPDFQRFGGNTAFVEGWALYAETLGYEMGFYKDPMQHWGTLDDEMLRAMRLVVDTGIHTKGWSREQAIDYMLANSGMGRTDATAEVERYIANPAQALAYKLGAMAIQRLRAKAEKALGAEVRHPPVPRASAG